MVCFAISISVSESTKTPPTFENEALRVLMLTTAQTYEPVFSVFCHTPVDAVVRLASVVATAAVVVSLALFVSHAAVVRRALIATNVAVVVSPPHFFIAVAAVSCTQIAAAAAAFLPAANFVSRRRCVPAEEAATAAAVIYISLTLCYLRGAVRPILLLSCYLLLRAHAPL